jgi:hypothetical protein
MNRSITGKVVCQRRQVIQSKMGKIIHSIVVYCDKEAKIYGIISTNSGGNVESW